MPAQLSPDLRAPSGQVAVIGAGVAGLTTAWALARDGWRVTVIDAQQPGAGASSDNGAQLSYAYVQPLADPGIWRQLPKLLLAPDSPLKIQLQADPAQWAWVLQFLAACRASVSRQSTAGLLALAARSRAALERLLAQEQLAIDFSASGKLVLYPDAEGFAGAKRQLALQEALGGPVQKALSAEQCLEVEPALARFGGRLAGGIHTPSECAADCHLLCQALHERLQARGVRFELGRPVRRLRREGRRLVAAETDAGDLAADAFVLAAGTGSARLGASVGLRLPVYPLKGYSLTLALGAMAGQAPRVSVTDMARKVVYARLGQRLRVAGMVELVGHDRQVLPERIAELQAAVRQAFPQLDASALSATWAGLRPATPTGLPLVGRRPAVADNLLLNTGHGALGLTLAMGSAEQVAAELRRAA